MEILRCDVAQENNTGERPLDLRMDILLRSFMFVPAFNRKFIEKALMSNADAIILDMEDSVPRDKRADARKMILEYGEKGMLHKKKVFIRINEIESMDFVTDISELVIDAITGFMPSKINCADDIIFLDRLLTFMERKNGLEAEKLLLAPLIETTRALAEVQEIAFASPRLVALCFGGEDYLNDLGSVYTYQASALVVPRALIANAARSAGLLPIDTPYIDIADIAGFEKAERQAYENGYAGCLVLSPRQIEAANRAFMPDNDQVIHSEEVIKAVQRAVNEKDSSIAMMDGKMTGPPMRKRAEAVIRQMELIRKQV